MRGYILVALAACSSETTPMDLRRVNHVVLVMQENHSFDNYFGVLPYAASGPYHPGPCSADDHACVDGLTCSATTGGLDCSNSNLDDDGSVVHSFHVGSYCVGPDLVHEWAGSHAEANFASPASTLQASPNDGFVRVNDATEQPDTNGEGPQEDETMGYYDATDLPFYYSLAQTFAISDRYFASVIGPTFPNRAYALAATSFGHVTTAETLPPTSAGYKPIAGTIMDLLDKAHVSWTNYYVDLPTTAIFRGLDGTQLRPATDLLALPSSGACPLPEVSIVDSAFGDNSLGNNPMLEENDEHPPSDIRKGQFFVSQVVTAIRNSSCWNDSVVFVTYDEHGGFYDHVPAPAATQGGARTPDGIAPGQCADATNPQPGTAAQCTVSATEVASICPGFSQTGTYPEACANFDQLGFRVPLMAVSPFSRPHYVSHVVADHTSLLAFIEKRFLPTDASGTPQHLTNRDAHAATLEDLFDFAAAPSRDTPVPSAPAAQQNDPGCPFTK